MTEDYYSTTQKWGLSEPKLPLHDQSEGIFHFGFKNFFWLYKHLNNKQRNKRKEIREEIFAFLQEECWSSLEVKSTDLAVPTFPELVTP